MHNKNNQRVNSRVKKFYDLTEQEQLAVIKKNIAALEEKITESEKNRAALNINENQYLEEAEEAAQVMKNIKKEPDCDNFFNMQKENAVNGAENTNKLKSLLDDHKNFIDIVFENTLMRNVEQVEEIEVEQNQKNVMGVEEKKDQDDDNYKDEIVPCTLEQIKEDEQNLFRILSSKGEIKTNQFFINLGNENFKKAKMLAFPPYDNQIGLNFTHFIDKISSFYENKTKTDHLPQNGSNEDPLSKNGLYKLKF